MLYCQGLGSLTFTEIGLFRKAGCLIIETVKPYFNISARLSSKTTITHPPPFPFEKMHYKLLQNIQTSPYSIVLHMNLPPYPPPPPPPPPPPGVFLQPPLTLTVAPVLRTIYLQSLSTSNNFLPQST